MAHSTAASHQSLVQYYDELVDFISLKTGNRQIANDVVQETYLRIFQRPEQFVGLIHPAAFLKKVSINIALDLLKRDKIYHKYFDALDDGKIDFIENKIEIIRLSEQEFSVVRAQYTEMILKKISALAPVCQDVFLLIQFYGMTQVDVAKQLGISRTMVIKHFTRALQHFIPLFAEEQN
ncbi:MULTISPECIES: sigma-70 family RNA polymerase sigma factor [unclassified Acinetobacter]|uniref:sigma-70 family RNA polymerase sigma factor n=1 Tax=unclassified Acinetobacter TaxID=196816 RepID=UPI002934B78B|nr:MULTISPECIES: sigma-70 family RNA polymerase sigma factor [unclassified Acinetobacter]WOE32639.1 sigma-70 family RNA polymerase sigma factor [Acinetobacter sp. SAAs470]WOE38115.1 sigma-70 family RNA polymerase sigma factor [Acinetobacter sp. SAAs474]